MEKMSRFHYTWLLFLFYRLSLAILIVISITSILDIVFSWLFFTDSTKYYLPIQVIPYEIAYHLFTNFYLFHKS